MSLKDLIHKSIPLEESATAIFAIDEQGNKPTVAEIARIAVADETMSKKPKIYSVVQAAIHGLDVGADVVVNQLLSVTDEEDIISGNLSAQRLRECVKIWLADGRPYYSGK